MTRWRVICRFSLEGNSVALHNEIKAILENKDFALLRPEFSFEKTGTALWESKAANPLMATAILHTVSTKLASNAELLDHFWLYIDQCKD